MTKYREVIKTVGDIKVIRIRDEHNKELQRQLMQNGKFIADNYDYILPKVACEEFAKDNVLLLGLGMGKMIPLLEQSPSVNSIIAVDINGNVSQLYSQDNPNSGIIIQTENAREYTSRDRFNFIYSDVLSFSESEKDTLTIMKDILDRAYDLLADDGVFCWHEYHAGNSKVLLDEYIADRFNIDIFRNIKYGHKNIIRKFSKQQESEVL